MAHKMRKGTRSCRECRRRKTRCIYTLGQEICKECNYHGRRCLDQNQALLSGEADIVDNRPNLRVRVARLESMLERLVQVDPRGAAEALNEFDLPMHARRDSGSSQRRSMYDVMLRDEVRRTHTNAESPLSSLFENEMLKRNDDILQVYRSSFYDPHDQQVRSRHELISKISLEPNILKVLHIAGSWWLPWRNLWPPLMDGDEKLTLLGFVHYSLAQENLINVASGLICIAICLQQMRPGADDYDIPFSAPTNELASNILTAVDQLALADEDNLASLDGLEALVLRAKSHVNASNQPRKSWLLIRRAIAMAQLIDLPRADPNQETAETIRRQRFMGALFETDRFMSLLMGLPYAVDDNFNDKVAKQVLHSPTNITTQMRALRRIVALVAGKVNDRNTLTPEAKESAMNLIQQTLDDAAGTLPCDWWNVKTHSDVSNDSQSSHEHLLTQLWFYQVQSFLHLPLMLKPASDSRFERSRLVCLSSSRNLLRVYQVLRQPHLAPYSSKCVDFQALIAAVLVLLGLLQHGSQYRQRADAGYKEDVDLINTTRKVFELSSMEQGGSIARQGVHMIDSLGAFVADGERSDFIRTATLFVPYFGTISVQSSRDKSAASAASERTNSIAYSDSSSSSQNPSLQQHPRPTSFPASGTSPSSYVPMPPITRQANAQPGVSLPGLHIENDIPATAQMPLVDHQQHIHASATTTTARKSSLHSPPGAIPLMAPTTFDHLRSDAPLAYNANDEKAGYVDVDIDWQRMMVGAELDHDCNLGVDSDAAQVF